jgi:hypothetical protein
MTAGVPLGKKNTGRDLKGLVAEMIGGKPPVVK